MRNGDAEGNQNRLGVREINQRKLEVSGLNNGVSSEAHEEIGCND